MVGRPVDQSDGLVVSQSASQQSLRRAAGGSVDWSVGQPVSIKKTVGRSVARPGRHAGCVCGYLKVVETLSKTNGVAK